MTPHDRRIVEELKSRLSLIVPNGLRRLIVFGSRARGDNQEDSDLDVVALVDKTTPELEQRMDDAAYAVMWDCDFRPVLSLKIFEEERFDTAVREGFPFYRNIAKEGLSL